MIPEADPSGGRPRRRWWVGILLGVLVVASLPLVSRAWFSEGGGTAATGPTAGLPERLAAGLRGRLVYLTDEPGRPGRQRIVVLDLVDGSVEAGPVVPTASTLSAVGPGRRWVLLLRREGDVTVADLLRGITSGERPVEVARGAFVSLSPDGRTVLVAEVGDHRPRGCPAPAYRLRRVSLATGRSTAAVRGPLPCGTLLAIAEYGTRIPLVSLTRPGGLPGTFALRSDGPELLFGGSTVSGGAPFLFKFAGGDIVLWPDGDRLRVGQTESGLLGRVLEWSADGRHFAVEGRVGAQVGLWLVDAVDGHALPLSTTGAAFIRRLGDATIDDAGTVFAADATGIRALTSSSLFLLDLPVDAPAPVRPIAWIP
jgi:hypothetical protein